jgi:hypothetical protein
MRQPTVGQVIIVDPAAIARYDGAGKPGGVGVLVATSAPEKWQIFGRQVMRRWRRACSAVVDQRRLVRRLRTGFSAP